MRIPYTQVGPDLFRPLLPVIIHSTAAAWLVEGLLDPGSDLTLLPLQWAARLGVDYQSLSPGGAVTSATGELVPWRTWQLDFDVRRDMERICWRADVAVTTDKITRPHWGFKGFLQYFRAEFDGPNLVVTLTPGANLPTPTPN